MSAAGGVGSLEVVVFSGEGVERGVPLEVEPLRAAVSAGRVVWVRLARGDVERAGATLTEAFGLHALALQDLISANERPKLDDYEGHSLLVLRVPCDERAGTPRFEPLGLAWGQGFVISVVGARDVGGRVVDERLDHPTSKLRTRPAEALVYALLDAALDGYSPLVEGHVRRLEELEEIILDSPERTTIYAFHELHRGAHRLRSVLTATSELLTRALRIDDESFSRELKPYLRDSRDHVAELLDQVAAASHLATSLVELRNSQLDQRMNEIMAWLSLVSTLFIPLSFVVGLYGMNFQHMPELRWRYSYPIVLLGLVGLASGFLLYFRRRGWLGRRGPFAQAESSARARREGSTRRRGSGRSSSQR